MSEIHIIDHPLVQHKLAIMRDKKTTSKDFRELLSEISMLMGYEVTRSLPIKEIEVETPVALGSFPTLADDLSTIVPILRAGLGMQDGLLGLMPFAHIGTIGLYREEAPDGSIRIVEYYFKMPKDVDKSHVFIVDPMLATGGSASAAITCLKQRGCDDIRLMCLVAAPEGIKLVQEDHPDVDIFVGAIDECLNEHAYIVPGLGDAGDRIFGTK
jgi:uracil phosphoribosyltransferase